MPPFIQAEAAEPTTDGPNKFVLSSKGHKHTFKAASAAERDNWVNQIKAKITEAKELAKTVTESEKYKATIASFQPQPVKKEEKAEDKKAEEKKAEEAPKAAEETTPATETAAPVTTETAATEAPKEEAKDVKTDERKRSASRKRASIFGALLGKKEEKVEEKKSEEKKEEPIAEGATETAPATTETPVATEATPEAPKEEGAKEPEAATAEPAATTPAAESPEAKPKAIEKPTPSKRARYVADCLFPRLTAINPVTDIECNSASSVDCLSARRGLRRPLLLLSPLRIPKSLR